MRSQSSHDDRCETIGPPGAGPPPVGQSLDRGSRRGAAAGIGMVLDQRDSAQRTPHVGGRCARASPFPVASAGARSGADGPGHQDKRNARFQGGVGTDRSRGARRRPGAGRHRRAECAVAASGNHHRRAAAPVREAGARGGRTFRAAQQAAEPWTARRWHAQGRPAGAPLHRPDARSGLSRRSCAPTRSWPNSPARTCPMASSPSPRYRGSSGRPWSASMAFG